MNLCCKRVKSVWVIEEVSTGLWYKCSSGKCAWETSGAAKNAFNLCTGVHFDKQDLFVLKELKNG